MKTEFLHNYSLSNEEENIGFHALLRQTQERKWLGNTNECNTKRQDVPIQGG